MRRLVALLLLLLVAGSAFAGEREEFDYALRLHQEGVYDIAIEQCEAFRRDYPDSYRLDRILFLQGECAWALGDWEAARAVWLRLSLNHPKSDHAAEALLRTADCLERLERPQDALRGLLRVYDYYPESPLAPQALLKAARLQAANPVEQRETLQILLRAFPAHRLAREAELELALGWLRAGESRRGIQGLRRLLQEELGDSLRLRVVLDLGQALAGPDGAAELVQLFESERPRLQHLPGVLRTHLLEGRSRLEAADRQGAMDCLQAAVASSLLPSLEQAPRDSLHLLLGDARCMTGDFAGAGQAWSSMAAQDASVVLRRALAAEWGGKPEDALDLHLQVLRDEDADPDLRLEALDHALGLASAGSLPELGRVLQQLDLGRAAPEALLSVCDGLLAHGRTEAAGRLLESLSLEGEELADDLLALEIRLAAAREDDRRASRLWNTFLQDYPLSPLRPELEVLYDNQVRPRAEAVEMNRRLLELMSTRGQRDEAEEALAFGRLYLEHLGDSTAALSQFDQSLAAGGSPATRLQAAIGRIRAGWSSLSMEERVRQSRQFQAAASAEDPARAGKLRDLELQALLEDAPEQDLELLQGLRRGAEEDPILLRRLLLAAVESLPDPPAEDTLLARRALAWGDTLQILSGLDAPCLLGMARAATLLPDQAARAAMLARELLQGYPAAPEVVEAEILLSSLESTSDEERVALLERIQQERAYHPVAREAGHLLVVLRQREGRWQEALSLCDSLLAGSMVRPAPLPILPARVDPLVYNRGRSLQELGRAREAVEAYRLLLSAAPQGDRAADLLLRLGQCSEALGESEQALLYYRNLNAFYPRTPANARGLVRMASIYAESGRETQALKVYDNLKEERRGDPLVGYGWIRALYAAGQLELGREQMSAYLKRHEAVIDKDTVSAAFNLEKGRFLLRRGRLDDAQKSLKVVTRRYDETRFAAPARLELARVALRAGREDDALELLEGLEKDPRLAAPASLERGWIFQRRGEGARAIAEVRRAVDAATDPASRKLALGRLIVLYRELGFHDGALLGVRQYLDEFPEAPDAFSKRIEVGLLLKELGDLPAAREQFRRLLPLADAEQEAALQFYIGECSFMEKDYRQAVLEFMKVPAIARDSKLDWGVTARYQVGQAWEKLGDTERAIEAYQQIVRERGSGSSYGLAAQERINQLRFRGEGG